MRVIWVWTLMIAVVVTAGCGAVVRVGPGLDANPVLPSPSNLPRPCLQSEQPASSPSTTWGVEPLATETGQFIDGERDGRLDLRGISG